MDAYIFQAALYCSSCAETIRLGLRAARLPDTGDSNDFPQGPYPNGGGEADTPQHCDGFTCNVFLENPLTTDGVVYVEEAIEEEAATRRGRASIAWTVWRPFYGLGGRQEGV